MPQKAQTGTTIERALELQALVARLDTCANNGGTMTITQVDAKAILEGLAVYGLAMTGRKKPGRKPNGERAMTDAERQANSRAKKAS